MYGDLRGNRPETGGEGACFMQAPSIVCVTGAGSIIPKWDVAILGSGTFRIFGVFLTHWP
ncbi:hypothetical protein GGR40_003597 [Novosphingobium gossypii]